jgi:hypothetical protein
MEHGWYPMHGLPLAFRAFNPKLFHAGFEGGGIDVENPGRALFSAHAPVGALQDVDDMLPFYFFQRQRLLGAGLAPRLSKPLDRFSFRSFTQDHCAFDHML